MSHHHDDESRGVALSEAQVRQIATLCEERRFRNGSLRLHNVRLGEFHATDVLVDGWATADGGQSFGEWLVAPDGTVLSRRGPGAGA